MANFQRKRKAKTKTYRAAKLKKLSETVEQQDKELTTELDHMETLSQGRWKNKQRVLVFTSRGITFKGRHLGKDLQKLMPHTKTGKLHRSNLQFQ